MKDMSCFDNSVDNPGHMQVRVFAAADGDFTLWEDAGDTPEDLDENWASTTLSVRAGNGVSVFTARRPAEIFPYFPKREAGRWNLPRRSTEKCARR